MNLSGQKDRAAELERKLQELKSQKPGDEEPNKEEVRAGDRLRVHELELERTSLKQELSVSAICSYPAVTAGLGGTMLEKYLNFDFVFFKFSALKFAGFSFRRP